MPRFPKKSDEENDSGEEDLGGQMSFLEHLDELRKRLIRSMIFVFRRGDALLVRVRLHLQFSGAAGADGFGRSTPKTPGHHHRTQRPGLDSSLASLKPNDKIRFVFPDATELGPASIPAGASVMARVDKDSQGNVGVYTDEPLAVGNEVVPKDVRLLDTLTKGVDALPDINSMLVVDTAGGAFALWVKVSLYAALGLSVPFLLWQIWAFVSPGLYPHERKYVTPFISLSSIFLCWGRRPLTT